MVWVRLNGFWNSVGFGSLAGRARQTLGSSQTLNSVSCDLQSPLGRCFDDSAASTLRLDREACEKAQKFRLQRSGVGVALRLLRAGTDTGSATETPESSNQSEMPRQHAKTLTKLLGSPAGANSRPPPIAASRRSGPFRTSKQPCGTARTSRDSRLGEFGCYVPSNNINCVLQATQGGRGTREHGTCLGHGTCLESTSPVLWLTRSHTPSSAPIM